MEKGGGPVWVLKGEDIFYTIVKRAGTPPPDSTHQHPALATRDYAKTSAQDARQESQAEAEQEACDRLRGVKVDGTNDHAPTSHPPH